MRNPIFKQAVVVGAGMAGLAAAKAISPGIAQEFARSEIE